MIRHNQKEIDERNKKAIEDSKRYVFERGSIDGKPTFKVTDRYLEGIIGNTTMEFVFAGEAVVSGQAAAFLEKLIKGLEKINERMPTRPDQMGHTLR